METLKKCLEYEGISGVGDEIHDIPEKNRGDIIALAKTVGDDYKYVVMRWSDCEGRYCVTFDPCLGLGYIKTFVNAYLLYKEKKRRQSQKSSDR